MRATWLAVLGLLLGSNPSGAGADVICDSQQTPDTTEANTGGALHGATKSCIEHVCTAKTKVGEPVGYFTTQCEQVILTVTHIDAARAQPNAEDCIAHISDIFDQCVTAKGIWSGTVQIKGFLYGAYTSKERPTSIQEGTTLIIDGGDQTFQARRLERVKWQAKSNRLNNNLKNDTKRTSADTSKSASKPKSSPNPTPKPKTSPKASPVPTPKPSKPKQDCNGRRDQGEEYYKDPKNLIGNALSSITSRLLRRAPPLQDGVSCSSPTTVHYRKRILEHGKVWAYYFDSSVNWQKTVTEGRANPVLTKMNPDGKFNVVVMKTADSYCIGDPNGKTGPYMMAVQSVKAGDKFLLTNGNYFVMGAAQNLEFHSGGPVIEDLSNYDHFAVGFTTSTPKQVNIPADHAQYYEEFRGVDGSSLMCGPGLKEPLNLNRPELQYWCQRTQATTEHALPHPNKRIGLVQSVYSQIPGGIAASNQPNERLVTVILQNDLKLVFTYTSRRSKGVNVNQMRSIVEAFLASFLKADIKIDTKQVLNLDGGGSIFVAWVKNKRWEIIAAGNQGGERTPPGWRPRMVTTMIKHTLG